MTEEEWLESADPEAMWLHLGAAQTVGVWVDGNRVKASVSGRGRKWRLLACSTFRAGGGGSWSNDAVWALATAENHADGLVTDDELRRAHEYIPRDLVAEFLLRPDASDAALSLILHYFPGAHADARGAADSLEVADLLRDIVGNPFRPVDMRGRLPGGKGSGIVYNPWLVNDTVQSLATAAYEARTPQGHLEPARLAVLADALEEAGCQEETLLQHLRGREPCTDMAHARGGGSYWCAGCGGTEGDTEGWMPLHGPHVRGCWSLDLVLGKG